MSDIISADRLVKRFRKKTVLDGVTFSLPRGSVTGLIGENGVGKTTLIRILLGLLEANGGESRVFGLPSLRYAETIRRRAGYVPDEYRFDEGITAESRCRFVGAFYPTWDDAFAGQLLERLRLAGQGKIKTYSKGMKARLLLVLALAHHPDLLILDEPFSGLDPAVRTDILQLLGDYVVEGERTVLISSHQFSDLERFCDRVLFLHRGRVRIDEGIESVKATRGELTAVFPGPVPAITAFPEATIIKTEGNTVTVYYRRDGDGLAAHLAAAGATVERTPLDLETIFLREVANV